MNIAILIPGLGGGGAERVAQRLGDYYFQNGDNVYYFLLETPAKQMYSVKGNVIETGIRSCTENVVYGNIFVFYKLLQSSWIMRKYKQKYQIDIAISFMEECSYMNVLSRGREKVITRVCTTLSKRTDMKGFLYNRHIVHFFYNLSDKIVVLSDYAKKDMNKNYGIAYRKLCRIPNFIVKKDTEETNNNWIYGEKVVICIGRLEPVKQQERIIRAFYYAQKYCKEAKLLILGTGTNKNYLEKLCGKYNIKDSVFFIGFTERVDYYLKNSRVFVMAGQELSREEIFLGEALVNILNSDLLYERYKKLSLKRASMYSLERVIEKWNELIGNTS